MEMRRRWAVAGLLALTASLLLVGVALAQDVGAGIPTPPDPPKARAGVYVTSEDNEDNAGTGVADNDMGTIKPRLICGNDPLGPIEFNIVVGEEMSSGGQLALAAWDFTSGLHGVYVNGHFLGTIPVQEKGPWEVLLFEVPQAVLKQGANLVEIEVAFGDCGSIAWGTLAQEFEPSNGAPPEPPNAVLGLYVTSEDNEDNARTGAADDDMGTSDPPWICPNSENAPIEFNIVVRRQVCSGGELTLAVMGLETGEHEVYVNDNFVALIPPQEDDVWVVLPFQVPQSALRRGENLVQIRLMGGDCGYMAWGALAIEPCAEEEFVPELGSLMLLGSGLTGLAGYAGLRWRNHR